MIVDDIYSAMYRAMECLYWEEPREGLLRFVSEANPHIWSDGESADPWLKDEFDSLFERKHSEKSISCNEAYDFVCKYLTQITQIDGVYREENTDLCAVFKKVTLPEWLDLCKIIQEEAAEG